MKRNKSNLAVNPYVLLGISILAIALSSIMIKSSNTPPSVAGMYRLYLTVLIMLPFLSWKKLSLIQITKYDWLLITAAGFFLGLHFLFWMESLSYTSVASSMVILTLQPLFVMIGSYFMFNERVTKLMVLCMITAVFGSMIIAWGDIGVSREALIGDALSLLGTVSISAYMLAGQKISGKIPANVYSVIAFFIGGTVMLIYSLINHFPLLNYSSSDWMYFLMLALIPTIFGHFIFNLLLQSIGATTVSVGVIGEPVLSIILAYFLLGEAVSAFQIFGGLLTIAGMGLYFIKLK